MDGARTNETFQQLVENLYLDKDGFRDLEPIDDVRAVLLDHLSHHIARLDDLGLLEEEYVLPYALRILTSLMNREFRALRSLKLGDTVVASGETVFMIRDPHEGERPELHNLSDNLRLHGTVRPLELREIPDEQELDLIRRLNHTNEQLEPVDLLTLNPFGLMLRLDDARLVDPSGDEQELSSDATVLLPLNYSTLHLQRLV